MYAVSTLLITATLAWPHPGFDAEDSHFNPHETAITATTVGHLHQLWTAKLRDAEESCSGYSAPILGDNRLYATDKEGISAYDPATGDVLWRHTWDHADDNSTPRMAVDGDTLILANGSCNSMSDPDGRLTALDQRGHPRWQLDLDNPIDSVVVDKHVVLVSGTSPSDEDKVAAYRVRDGKLLWSQPGHASSGVSADGLVPLISTNGYGQPAGATTAVDITTGVIRWTRPLALQVLAASPPADRYYATDPTGVLVALNASTGATLWTRPGQETPLVATDGPHLYLAVDRKITAVAAATGRALWSRNLPAAAAQPVLAADLLYTGGPVLNAQTGTPAGPTFSGAAVPAGGRLFQDTGSHLTAYIPLESG
ncbi:PQQ-binding-like beta-propeller repeat protein [Actinoplanes sp. NPDC020271]|uniref:PQQ-binding-like beta-propeller repeat protein n=1 Tax=Actinoplanes sp. NPDC020271 TaxID=3363896 RepID=UPI0037B50E5C